MIFEVFQFQRPLFIVRDVQRQPSIVFGWLWGPLGLPKTWIPLGTSMKNPDFEVPACKTRLGRTSEASSWSTCSSWRPFDGSLANLTGVRRCWSVFLPSDGLWAGFWVVFGSTWLFRVGFLQFFLSLRHFASQPNVSTTSGCLACVDLLFLSNGSHVMLTYLSAWLCSFHVYPATVGLWR